MGRVSITVSYSSRCLTTETVKYINKNYFIGNLAASKLGLGNETWYQYGTSTYVTGMY